MRRLLNPARYGFFAVQLFTQKVLMRAMAPPLAIAAASALVLARRRRLYAFAALAQALFYGFASVGFTNGRSGFGSARIFTIPAYFVLVNAGTVQAWWQFLRGDKLTRWEPKRARDAEIRGGGSTQIQEPPFDADDGVVRPDSGVDPSGNGAGGSVDDLQRSLLERVSVYRRYSSRHE
jgi:hypothetical protein